MTAAESYPGPRQIRHPYGLVLLGMAAGMGFGILENILWVFAVGRDLGWVIPIFRSAVCIPFHAMLGGLIGEKLARNRWFGEDNGWLSCTWLPIVLHALFDFCLLFLGVLAIQRSYDRQDEIGFTSGALVGAFLVFLVTAAALWYKSKVLFEDSDSLPALEYRPMSLMPNEVSTASNRHDSQNSVIRHGAFSAFLLGFGMSKDTCETNSELPPCHANALVVFASLCSFHFLSHVIGIVFASDDRSCVKTSMSRTPMPSHTASPTISSNVPDHRP